MVRCEGEVNRPGILRHELLCSILPPKLNTLSVVHRKGVGVVAQQ